MNDQPAVRRGWTIVHSSAHVQAGAALVRISNGDVRFYLPQEQYEDLDDEAFLALCEVKRDALPAPGGRLTP